MPPTYLYGKERALKNIFKELENVQKIFLFLDYDGTLVPIRKLPALAVISPETRKLLRQLSEQKKITLVISTGRAHADINRLLGLKNLTIVSNHGFQIHYKGKTWVHPKVNKILPLLNELSRKLNVLGKSINSVLVENKKYTVTVHYRNVPVDQINVVKNLVASMSEKYFPFVKITYGKKVLEIRPNIVWNKGLAVQKVLRTFHAQKKKYSAVYMGDDTTDEDAFKVLGRNSLTVKVGSSKKTLAKYFVRNTDEVLQFLKIIVNGNYQWNSDG